MKALSYPHQIYIKKIKWVISHIASGLSLQLRVTSLRELSNGHFSADNQKRLNGVDLQVPVYEAKMTGDTRLVVCYILPSFRDDN